MITEEVRLERKAKEHERVKRCLDHIPVGLLNGAIFVIPAVILILANASILIGCMVIVVSVIIGIIFAIGFLIYEINEDGHWTDMAFKDIQGWLIGLPIPLIPLFIVFLIRG